MSQSDIQRFVADLKANATLREAAEKTVAGTVPATQLDTLVSFATSNGYAFATDEVRQFVTAGARAKSGVINDAELENIAGGMDFGALPPEINSGRMYAGPGSAPLTAAASGWSSLSRELGSPAAATELASLLGTDLSSLLGQT